MASIYPLRTPYAAILAALGAPLAVGLTAPLLASEDPAPSPAPAREAPPPAEDDDELAERGEYLVHAVAMCHECHTPRDPRGDLIEHHLLQGAPMPVPAPPFLQRWGLRAPALAGLPGYSDDEALRLLTRGVTRRGTEPRPPMPRYRFDEDDARAVIAYLRRL